MRGTKLPAAILAAALLAGCSGKPSVTDAKTAIEKKWNGTADMYVNNKRGPHVTLSVENPEKLDGIDRQMDGESLYEMTVRYTLKVSGAPFSVFTAEAGCKLSGSSEDAAFYQCQDIVLFVKSERGWHVYGE